MFFTQEDYRKIEKWLLANSRKDTDFVGATTPLKGNETVVLVQDGKNVKTSVKDIVDQFFLLGVSDFLNITDKYGESYISIDQAIQLIPFRSRKEGQVITFLNTDGNWEIYQFIGKLNQWNNPTLWNNPLDWEKFIIDSILPDEEDLTKSVPNAEGNSYLSLKDRKYEPANYSGLGRVILRRRVIEIEDPVYGTQEKNLLLQADFNEENTVYVVRYDFTLGEDITVPANCILEFDGGSISDDGTHTLTGNNTIISSLLTKIFDLNIGFVGNWGINELYPEWFGAQGYTAPINNQNIQITGMESSVSAFNKIISIFKTTNIRNIKLNAVYFIDDQIVITDRAFSENGNSVNIVSDNPSNGFICQMNDTGKYYITINNQIDSGGVFEALYKNFTFYLARNSNVKGVFHARNILRSKFENLRCYGSFSRMEEAIYVIECGSGSNNFTLFFDNCSGFDTVKGHGLYYKVSDNGYLPILQTIIGCKFQQLFGGCGIVTDIKTLAQGTFNGIIQNCELEGNSKGSMFVGAVDGLVLENVYYEGSVPAPVIEGYSSAPFTLGLCSEQRFVRNLTINGMNVGVTGGQNADYAISFGHEVGNLGAVFKSVNIKNVNYVGENNMTYIKTGTNCYIEDLSKEQPTVDISNIQSAKDVIIKGIEKEIKVINTECAILYSYDTQLHNIEGDTHFYVTEGVLEYKYDTSHKIGLYKGMRIQLNGITYISPYGGKLYYNTKGDYQEASYNITNVFGAWMAGGVGATLTGPYWEGGSAVITAINGTTVTVDKPALLNKTGGIVSQGIMIDERIYSALTGKPNTENMKVGTMSFDGGRPIWWNGTRWVDNTGFPVGLTRGTTAQRPSLGESDYGYMYYDNELMKYITWSGLTWMNIDGTPLT